MDVFFNKLPKFLPGWVWLVGSGPGDPGLLTLHAANAIKQADVIVYDALVNTEILSFAKKNVILEYAGKRGGKPSPKQRDISLRLVELARSKKRILRLKGGDPFVFGRGGEEALSLVEYKIPFRIIPGITAGVGGLAYAGIPATHRNLTHAVTFLTGHASTGKIPDSIDWKSVARGSPVIILYMAVKYWDVIRNNLVEAGRCFNEPVAFITNATTPQQKTLVADLNISAQQIKMAGIYPPAIIVIGEIVKLRSGLDWLGAMKGLVLNPDPLNLKSLAVSQSA